MSYGSHYTRRKAWWGYVKSFIRKYKFLKDMEPKEMTETEMREVDAVKAAVDATLKLNDGEIRIRLVDIIFWKRTHTLEGAAMILHISERTARRWHTEFIRTVAKEFGLD